METSYTKLSLTPDQVRPFKMPKDCSENTLAKFGIGVSPEVKTRTAMDSLAGLMTTASVPTPVQFLQYFLPQVVEVVTAAMTIDEILGRETIGEWKQEKIVTTIVEHTGTPRPYGDTTSTPLANVNMNFEPRTVVRMEEGIEVNLLEQERSAEVKLDAAEQKRKAAAKALALELNRIGFFGFNNGQNRTYGFLNDPNLPAYVSVASGVSGYTWSVKTFLEICKDIRTAVAGLRTKSGNLVNPMTTNMTMVVPTACIEYLSTTTDLGMSVTEWINKTYPKMRVISSIELDEANGGANVFYLFADELDGQRTFRQLMVQAFRLLGIARREKGYTEAYSNATAGVILNMPIGVVRYTGI